MFPKIQQTTAVTVLPKIQQTIAVTVLPKIQQITAMFLKILQMMMHLMTQQMMHLTIHPIMTAIILKMYPMTAPVQQIIAQAVLPVQLEKQLLLMQASLLEIRMSMVETA